jgi:hypothetical protein
VLNTDGKQITKAYLKSEV